MPLVGATPAELRAYGDQFARSPEWGPNPRAWQVAMAPMSRQDDWVDITAIDDDYRVEMNVWTGERRYTGERMPVLECPGNGGEKLVVIDERVKVRNPGRERRRQK